MFPNDEEIQEDHEGEEGTRYYVRITDLPLQDKLRELRSFHLNTMVRVTGVVTRRTGVFPQLKVVMFDCAKCGNVLGPFTQNSDAEVKPQHCPNCSGKGPFNINSAQTVYRDYQKLTLQESPGTVPAGRLPRQKEVILLNDMIDCARPGEEIDVTGGWVGRWGGGDLWGEGIDSITCAVRSFAYHGSLAIAYYPQVDVMPCPQAFTCTPMMPA